MLSRTTRTVLSSVKSHVQQRQMAHVPHFKPPTMDELPVPQGSWQHAYAAAQRENNIVLLAGTAIFSATLLYTIKSGIVDFGVGPTIGKNED